MYAQTWTGEFIVFRDSFDVSTSLSDELYVILSRIVPVQLLTDSTSLFDAISKSSRSSQKRFMLDIAAAHEGLHDKAISDIGFARSESNLTDGLKKEMAQSTRRESVSSS